MAETRFRQVTLEILAQLQDREESIFHELSVSEQTGTEYLNRLRLIMAEAPSHFGVAGPLVDWFNDPSNSHMSAGHLLEAAQLRIQNRLDTFRSHNRDAPRAREHPLARHDPEVMANLQEKDTDAVVSRKDRVDSLAAEWNREEQYLKEAIAFLLHNGFISEQGDRYALTDIGEAKLATLEPNGKKTYGAVARAALAVGTGEAINTAFQYLFL
jgi:hypothetical protein